MGGRQPAEQGADAALGRAVPNPDPSAELDAWPPDLRPSLHAFLSTAAMRQAPGINHSIFRSAA